MRGGGSVARCWCECKMVRPLQKTARPVLKRLKMGLSPDPAIPLVGVCPGEMRTYGHDRT